MSDITITLIIFAIAIIFYIIDTIPLTLVSVLAMLAFVFTGVLEPSDAFSGFSATSTLMVAGMLIMGEAFCASGLTRTMGNVLHRFTNMKRKWFVSIVYLITGVLSIFMNGTAILAIFFPILDSVAITTEGRIPRKSTYFAAGIATVTGACCSIAGAASILTGVSLLAESEAYGKMLPFFAPAVIGAPIFLSGLVIYMTFGSALQDRCFDFPDTVPEIPSHTSDGKGSASNKKMLITGITFLVCIVFWISNKFNLAAVTLLGATVLLVAGCVRERTAYSHMSWETVIVIGATVGMAKGMDVSGAGEAVSNTIINLAGSLGESPFGMCILLLIIGNILSNFMSNTSAILITVPIAISISQTFGMSPVPFAMACMMGSNVALATPICTACMTMTLPAGYRFKDFFRVGGVFNLVKMIVAAVALKVVYFM